MRRGTITILLMLALVLVGVVGDMRGESSHLTQMMISPGVAQQGRTLHVAFGGSSPAAMLKVEVCPQGERSDGLMFWVQADDAGSGRFTVGVPCTWDTGSLVVLRVDDQEMRVPLISGDECRRLRGWLTGWEREKEEP